MTSIVDKIMRPDTSQLSIVYPTIFAEVWLKWFDTSFDEAMTPSDDISEEVKLPCVLVHCSV